MTEKIEKYLMDGKGNPSSSRLMAWKMMHYFFFHNTFFGLLIAALAYFIEDANVVLNYMLVFALAVDILLILAIFAPKQLNKISEVREMIATIGNVGKEKNNGDTSTM